MSNSTPKARQGTVSTLRAPPSPEKPPRAWRGSQPSDATTGPPPAALSRKRTSSGVFQIDEVEPPPKKEKGTEKVNNVKEKTSDKMENKVGFAKKFATDNRTCVTAFKESDSWD